VGAIDAVALGLSPFLKARMKINAKYIEAA